MRFRKCGCCVWIGMILFIDFNVLVRIVILVINVLDILAKTLGHYEVTEMRVVHVLDVLVKTPGLYQVAELRY